jgi:hypothetical protein
MTDHGPARDDSVQSSRREFVRKAAYVAPAILTLAAAPAFAKAGSGRGPPFTPPGPPFNPPGPPPWVPRGPG